MEKKKGRPGGAAVVMGRYELGRLLGHGTFSKVYHARSLVSGEAVAVKVIDKEKALLAGAGMAGQIEREIAAMRLVGRHPNVVRLHEVMATRTKIYFVMDLVRGGELLARLVAVGGRLGEAPARRYFRQLVAAVDYCHSRGVYHRDLKPENLLVDDDDGGNLKAWFKVSDFGLSALRRPAGGGDGRLLHTTCGTPSYVAPEIIGNKGYDGATADVWSCGVILFLLLAGHLPFFHSNLMEMYNKITKSEFRFPDWFSLDARSLISRLLDPNPKTRITIDDIINHPWLNKGHHNPTPATSSNNFKSIEEEEEDKPANLMKPASLNAFEIISLSHGFDLSGLFCNDQIEKKQEVFVSGRTASAIVSRLEEIAEAEEFEVEKKRKKKKQSESEGMTVKMKGWREGRKGRLAVDAEILEVSPSCYVVEVKKTAGDTMEYQAFCSRGLRPSLKDVCWST
uniref:non-specific serine/threonine protein kinase n=1 Tax=Leersia perrieri TaxID=77586 RepID=A0A0D9WDT7_9ORYZ